MATTPKFDQQPQMPFSNSISQLNPAAPAFNGNGIGSHAKSDFYPSVGSQSNGSPPFRISSAVSISPVNPVPLTMQQNFGEVI